MNILAVQQYKDQKSMFEPAYEADVELFKHCTGGLIAETGELLLKLSPVFHAHGVKVEWLD